MSIHIHSLVRVKKYTEIFCLFSSIGESENYGKKIDCTSTEHYLIISSSVTVFV